MDEIREIRASQFLVPKTPLLEYRREEARVEFKSIEMRDGLETGEKPEPLARVQDGKAQDSGAAEPAPAAPSAADDEDADADEAAKA
jgi:hypothetical protein